MVYSSFNQIVPQSVNVPQTNQMLPVSLIEDLIKPQSQPTTLPSYQPQILTAPVLRTASEPSNDILHEIRQIKYIVTGISIAIFFMLLVLILKKN
jgi:hypothetical protein